MVSRLLGREAVGSCCSRAAPRAVGHTDGVLLLPRKTLPGRIHPRGQERPIHRASPAVRPQQCWPVLSPAPRGRYSRLCLLISVETFFFFFGQTILMVMLSPLGSDVPSCDTFASCFFCRGRFVGMPRAPCAVERMSTLRGVPTR